MFSTEVSIHQIIESIGYVVKPYKLNHPTDPANTIYTQVTLASLPGIRLDFALLQAKIAIEVHGDYWHATDRSLRKLTAQQMERRIRDDLKRKLLHSQSWKLIAVHESEIASGRAKDHIQRGIWAMLDL